MHQSDIQEEILGNCLGGTEYSDSVQIFFLGEHRLFLQGRTECYDKETGEKKSGTGKQNLRGSIGGSNCKKIVAAFYKRKRTFPQHITKNSYNTDNPGFVKRFCSFYPEILLYRNGTEYIVNRLFRLGCGGEDTRCFWKSPIFLRHGLRNSSSQKYPFDTVCK